MSDIFSCDAVVVGAGAVGLAVARKLAMAGLETMILEKNAHFGMETSARNSEVIHAGIYYPKQSRKAEFCVQGRDLLYRFCESHGVGYKKLGKLIVATHADQAGKLAGIAQAAADNGVDDLKPLSKTEIAALEPDLFAMEGLFSPSTGIIDSHQYMLALLGDAQSHGATLVRKAEVTAITKTPEGYALQVANDGSIFVLNARVVINSAGLWAQHIAGLVDALPRRFVPPLRLAKGNYAILSLKSPFRHLIYPVPETGGLGVHLTLDLGGQARFGPSVEWLESDDPAKIDYAVPSSVPKQFVPLIARYWPAIREEMLTPGYSGVRPKTAGPENPNQDFQIDGPQVHGLPGLVNLFAIESPGLTASLAVADHVAGISPMKLGLGTVQFGQAYGVSNTRGQVSAADAAAILARAAQAGVRVLDTAANYGQAERVLTELDTTPFRIVTKTVGISQGVAEVVARAKWSASSLKADTLLVHAAADLEHEELWPALQRLKTEGIFRKIGISTYVADKPVELAARFKPDVMQLPFSVLDQRLLADGTLARLKEMGVEVHARSLFLQGLLLMEQTPEKLRAAGPDLTRIRAHITEAGSTPLAAALGFVLSRPEIDIGLVGVTSLTELNEILAAAARPLPALDWPSLALKDERVLTPSLW